MKSWFGSSSGNKRQQAWKLAKSLRDTRKYPWFDNEEVLAEAFVAQNLDAAAYRQAIYALTDWHNIQTQDNWAGYSKAQRDHRADVIATMEIVLAQSELS